MQPVDISHERVAVTQRNAGLDFVLLATVCGLVVSSSGAPSDGGACLEPSACRMLSVAPSAFD